MSGAVEDTRAYRRLLAAAAWAGGSADEWDSSVRPVLAELAELVAARRVPGADPTATAREHLGRLWPLVDRGDRCDPAGAAPNRDTLLTILDRLEDDR